MFVIITRISNGRAVQLSLMPLDICTMGHKNILNLLLNMLPRSSSVFKVHLHPEPSLRLRGNIVHVIPFS